MVEETKILTPMKAIRAKCLDCMCGQATEVRLCPVTDCSLYSYRMGHNPNRKGKGGKFAPKTSTQEGISEGGGEGESWYTALDDDKISEGEEGYRE